MRGQNRAPALVWAEVDLTQLKRNLRVIRARLAGTPAEILAVVKADAYGHGMKAVARTLRAAGVRFFGVANIDEAEELREVCPRENILVLGSFHGSQVPRYIRHRVIPTVSSPEDVAVLEAALPERGSAFPVHVKVDTGMGRLGVWHEEAEDFFGKIACKKMIRVEGIYTHFANADKSQKRFTSDQIRLFNRTIEAASRQGLRPRYLHAANSLGLIRFPGAHFNLVRPGIILYGLNPSSTGGLPRGIKPILSLKTRISFLKVVGKGRVISYGSTYKTPRKTRIATLPVGYSHGYRVGFSNKASVIVRGVKCPVAGRVTMDQTLVDVGRLRSVKRWDEVTLIGKDKRSRITARDLANLIDSISYEIACSIHSRIPRVYRH